MQIEDIVPDISTMSNIELMERIRLLRRSRNTKKEVSLKPDDRPKAKEKKQSSAIDLIGAMSPEDKKKLLSKLLGV